MYRVRNGIIEVLLIHPGGPFWKNKDVGAWTIPKGELNQGEDPLAAAQREFQEELGITATAPFHPLGSIQQKGGKVVHGWAFEGDCDPTQIQCSFHVELEWPPRSGKKVLFPEIDRAEFFTVDQAAAVKINPAQAELLSRLKTLIGKSATGT